MSGAPAKLVVRIEQLRGGHFLAAVIRQDADGTPQEATAEAGAEVGHQAFGRLAEGEGQIPGGPKLPG